MSIGHRHSGQARQPDDQRWLLAALGVIGSFMIVEVVVGLLAGSLALITDAGHLLTDAAALAVAVIAARLARRPPVGAYTYGFTRLDALSAQANGITLLVLACWSSFEAVRRLLDPPRVHGGPVLGLALAGIAVNGPAVLLAGRASQDSLNVRGAMAHLVTDLWAFLATAAAGLVILLTGWARADAIASLVIAALMVYSGLRLVTAAGRVFLEAAPAGTDPAAVGQAMAAVPGVREVHDLHVWDLGVGDAALSAHVVVEADYDCHEVARGVRSVLAASHQISHATLQADHRPVGPETVGDELVGDDCAVRHGPGYVHEIAGD